MTEYRTEKDSMGEVRVPEKAYYGSFTARAKENFRISVQRTHPKLIWALGVIKQAAAEANKELEMLDKDKADAITEASKEVQEGEWNDQFVVDPFQAGAGTPVHMNANEVVANRATELLGGDLGEYLVHPNNHVNMGQSSNNVFPAAIRIASLFLLRDLIDELEELGETFEEKADKFSDVIKPGRTHMQDAVPILLGQEMEAYAEYCHRGARRLENVMEGLRELGTGGTAVGTGLTAHPDFGERCAQYISEITGEEFRETEEHVYLTQSTNAFMDVANVLRSVANDMLKIGGDLNLMVSGPRAGLGEITLPEVEPGSSIMPGKVNPSIVESFQMVCLHVLGNAETVDRASSEGQFELNVMTPVIAHDLIEGIELMTEGVHTFREKAVEGMEANRAHVERTFANSLSVSTALSPYLGYEVTAHIVREALRGEKSVKDVVLDRGLFDEKELSRILHPNRLTKARPVDRELKRKVHQREAYEELRREVEE